MKFSCQTTRLSADCVRVQITPYGQTACGSALNRYGFIFEDAFVNDTEPQLEINWHNNENGSLDAMDEENQVLFKLLKADFSPSGATVEFDLFDENEDFIGFGDQTRERLFHRNCRANCNVSNVSSYIPVPFFMSTRGYGILVNSTYQVIFDMGCTDKKRFCWFDKSGCIDFYVWKGENFKSLISTYTLLTGRPELPPRWSFGLWFICRTQANDAEVMSNARDFRNYNIPCDVIGLEPGWMDTVYDYTVDKV